MNKNTACLSLCLYFCFVAAAFGTGANPKVEQELNVFIKNYVDATNTHDFANVQPLLMPDAIYWFNKEASEGMAAVKVNFERTWSYLPDEVYGIENIKWLSVEKGSATCIYEYTYQGTHAGKPVSGRGRGTSVLVKQDGKWRIAHEHLSIPH
ncbi:DUF4440 domain-containing protein [Pontibacter sp. FD36]|uniref:YybH family protein n=1 Tax=Pontibacter sp. FD36 TaxID=2789860 RepID=UPI0018A9E57C|nr:nuclear transport factor 2 family protein [Pontibacter sp. FD36]MBF8964065.1 DUF4440 domain-containing protein [Pontibacter sp. FD36]